MFKKLVVTAAAIGAGAFLLTSTHMGGYARTAWIKARSSVQKQIPLEFQLESIRNEVAELMPDMRRHISQIAAETVAVEGLREEVVAVRTSLENQKELVRNMGEELRRSDTHQVVFRNRKYANERFQERLAIELQSAKQCAEGLKAKEQLLEAKERGLETAKAQLGNMRNQKQTLEVQIAQLEAELKTLRLAQAQSDFQLDDSRLSHIKGAIANVQSQMRVVRTEAALVGEFEGTMKDIGTTAVKSKAELVKDVQEFLGTGEVVSAEKTNPEKTEKK